MQNPFICSEILSGMAIYCRRIGQVNGIFLMSSRLEGNEKWKANPRSDDYDHRMLNSRLSHLRSLAGPQEASNVMFILRSGIEINAFS